MNSGTDEDDDTLFEQQRAEAEPQVNEAIQMEKLHKEVLGANRINEGKLLTVSATGDASVTKKKQEAWKKLRSAMKIDDANLQKHTTQFFLMGMVKLGFLAVIVGCELDLYAFIMSYPNYFNMKDPHNQIQGKPISLFGTTVDFNVIRLLLVVGPCGYITAVFMYWYLSPQTGADVSSSASTPKWAGYATKKRTKTQMQYYHFFPLCRYYLLIKDSAAEDIECLFRINALSTFTLGTAQIVCIVFHLFVFAKPANIFIKVGLVTQAWNLIVTLLYFLSPLSTKMMSAVSVNSLKSNVEKDVMDMHRAVLDAMVAYSKDRSAANRRKKDDLSERIDREIALLGGLAGEDNNEEKMKELKQYDMDLKTEALGHLRRIHYLKFAQIGK